LRDVYKEDEEVDTTVDTKQETVDTKEEEPEKDLDEYKDEIKQEAKEEARLETQQQILKAIGVTKGEKDEAEEAGWQTPWEKRGESKPKSWQEAVEAGADLADFRKQAEDKVKEKEIKQAETAKKEQQEQYNKYWDEQLEDLRRAGKIPDLSDEVKEKVTKGQPLSEEERKDPGLNAQVNLINTMTEVSKQRRAANKPPIYNLKEIFYEHYTETKAQRAGADAPVSGGKTSVKPAPSGDDDMTYEQLKKSSFEDIIRQG
jgi:hypothetical protein